MCIQCVKPDVTKMRFNIQLNGALVKICGRRLDSNKIVLCPNGHPFSDTELTGSNIGLCINFGCDLPKILRDLLLRFPRDAALNLLAGTSVVPLGIAPLPVSVFFSVASGCDLSDRTGTVSAFFIFILDMPEPVCYNTKK